MALRETRRRFLRGSALFAMGTAGCLDQSTSGDGTAGGRATATADPTSPTEPTTTPVPLSAYSFDWTAAVVERATRDRPPELRLELTNAGSRTAELGFGLTPPFSDPLAESADGGNRLLVFHPEMGPHSAPDTRTDGCWRLDGEEPVGVNTVLVRRRLEPGDTLGETYTLYDMPGNGACFPDGSYAARGTPFLPADSGRELRLGITVRIEDGRVASATAETPSIAPE